MKKLSNYKFILLVVFVATLAATCTKKKMDVRFDPQVETTNMGEVTSSTAEITGYVVSEGDGFSEKGICYNTLGDPTIDDSKAIFDGDMSSATFTVTLTDLDYSTTYYATAYGISESGVVYGSDTTFTTDPVFAIITTTVATDIAGTTATSGGEITDAGGSIITGRGVVYSTEANPTIDDSNDMYTEDGSGEGTFISSLTGMDGETTYYYRAYAISSAGVAYGDELELTTLVADRTWYLPGNHQGWAPDVAPIITNDTDVDPNILAGYAWLNTEFKFTPEPNWDNSWGDNGADGTLEAGGANIAVTPGYYYIEVDYNALTYTLTLTDWGLIGDATPGGWGADTDMTYSPETQTWLLTTPLTANFMKFRANDAWDLDYGDTGADGTLEAGGDNIAVATAGDFTVTMDLSTPHNYTYSVRQWGIIGDATPTGWGSDTDMTIVGGNNQWTVTLDLLAAGSFKFRANDAWDFDYGDTGADGTLEAGGDNMTVATDGNYTITIDLATLTYTIVMN